MRPTLTLDFDGVLHGYQSGWQGAGNIPDPPVPGAINFLKQALSVFTVVICSSRCVQEKVGHLRGPVTLRDWPIDEYQDVTNVLTYQVRVVSGEINTVGVSAMCTWLLRYGLTPQEVSQIEFWACKPPSHVMVDDRALRFDGDWSKFDLAELAIFKPWNHHLRHEQP